MGRRATARGRPGELRALLVGAALVLLAVVAVTGLFVLAAQRLDIGFSDLSRDPASIVGAPPYTGWFANITILVWQVPASVALFTALVMRRAGDRVAARMFLVVGLISAVMVVDDFFQGHEILQYNLGVPGTAVFATYTIAALGWAWWFRRRLGVHVLTVLAAMGCWGVSAVVDTLLNENAPYAIEDGAKLAGVALWGFMVVRVARLALADRSPAVPDIPALRSAQARHRASGVRTGETRTGENRLADARTAPTGDPLPVEGRRVARIPAPRDPEATTPVRHVPARSQPLPPSQPPLPVPSVSGRPRPLPRSQPPLPVPSVSARAQPLPPPQPLPRRQPQPRPQPLSGPRPVPAPLLEARSRHEPAPQPVWAPPRVVHDIRGPATPPPVRRPDPVPHSHRR